MTKYERKHNEILSIFFDKLRPIIANIYSNNVEAQLQNFYSHIASALHSTHIVCIKQEKLESLHAQQEYPLMFLYLRYAYDNNILAKYVSYLPDLNNFATFLKWFDEHQIMLDYSKLYRDVKDRPIMEELASFMFRSKKVRGKLNNILYNNVFIGLDTQQEFETSNLVYTEYLLDEKDTVHVFLKDGDTFEELAETALVISLIKNITGYTKPIDLTILYSRQKKKFPPKGETFCPRHINSGMSMQGMQGKLACCWRKEELVKVIIHELLHLCGADETLRRQNDQLKIGRYVGVDYINEAYIETMAVILNCLLRTAINQKDVQQKVPLDKFIDKISREILFTFYQVAKIIKVCNGSKWADFSENKIEIQQMTSVRSYFINKMLLLTQPEFFLWMDGSIIISSSKALSYVNLLEQCFDKFNKNSHFTQIIDAYCNLNIDTQKYIACTGRLTDSG